MPRAIPGSQYAALHHYVSASALLNHEIGQSQDLVWIDSRPVGEGIKAGYDICSRGFGRLKTVQSGWSIAASIATTADEPCSAGHSQCKGSSNAAHRMPPRLGSAVFPLYATSTLETGHPRFVNRA